MLICYHGDHSGNVQTCHQSRHTSISFWLPEGFLYPYSHWFKVCLCWDSAPKYLVWLLNIIKSMTTQTKWGILKRCLNILKQQTWHTAMVLWVRVTDLVLTLADQTKLQCGVGHHWNHCLPYLLLISAMHYLHNILLITVSCKMWKHCSVLIPTKSCYVFRHWSSYMWLVNGNAVTTSL